MDVPEATKQAACDAYGHGPDRFPDDMGRAIEAAVLAERERCAVIAGLDVDWTNFGKQNIEPWENGMDSLRDYRLGLVAGRTIAAAIRKPC